MAALGGSLYMEDRDHKAVGSQLQVELQSLLLVMTAQTTRTLFL